MEYTVASPIPNLFQHTWLRSPTTLAIFPQWHWVAWQGFNCHSSSIRSYSARGKLLPNETLSPSIQFSLKAWRTILWAHAKQDLFKNDSLCSSESRKFSIMSPPRMHFKEKQNTVVFAHLLNTSSVLPSSVAFSHFIPLMQISRPFLFFFKIRDVATLHGKGSPLEFAL